MPDTEQSPHLSLVIPAYNEALHLPLTLAKIAAYISQRQCGAEILVVDDGSTDNTADVVRRFVASDSGIRLIRTPHRGKGHAVRTGLLASRGRVAFLCDADLSMPITELDRFLVALPAESDVAIASREGAGARRFNEPVYRHVMGRVFNAFVRVMILPGIQDSQCGFKYLPGQLARELAAVQTLDGWGFDVELLTIARLWGYRIVEIPIAWYYVRGSRIRPLHDAWHMVREVFAVRRNLRRGCYGRPMTTASDLPEPPDMVN